MGYDDEPVARRRLTPLESELRATARVSEPWQPAKRGPWRRLREWRRSRQPPQTWAGAIALGLIGLAVTVAVCAGAALAFSSLTDRPFAIGLYVVGGICAFSGIVVAANDREYSAYTGAPRMTSGAVTVVSGLLTVALGVLAEVVA